MTIAEVLDNTDWKLLREQKRALIQIGEAPWAESLCFWIDAIQDAAAEAGYPVEWLTEGDGGDGEDA